MRHQAGLALVQPVRVALDAELAGNRRAQQFVLRIVLQQRPQRDADLAEQAQPQVALGGDAQAVAAGAEIARIRRDHADAPGELRMRVFERGAGIEAARLRDPAAGWRAQPRAADAGPAIEYAHPDYAGRIGVIAPYARDFCASCNRLRVTAKGDLRLCLGGEIGIPLRPLLQEDAQHELLCATISRQLGIKRDAHRLHQGQTGLVPHLASIGG